MYSVCECVYVRVCVCVISSPKYCPVPVKTVLAPKVMTVVKCNRKLEQRAIQLQSLHTMNKI